jgi:uncharacterized protein (DUF952 family)
MKMYVLKVLLLTSWATLVGTGSLSAQDPDEVMIDVDYSIMNKIYIETNPRVQLGTKRVYNYYGVNFEFTCVDGKTSNSYSDGGEDYALVISRSYGQMEVPDVEASVVSYQVESNCNKSFSFVDRSFFYWVKQFSIDNGITNSAPSSIMNWYNETATEDQKASLNQCVQQYGVEDYETLFNNCPSYLINNTRHDPWSVVHSKTQAYNENDRFIVASHKLPANAGGAFRNIGHLKTLTLLTIKKINGIQDASYCEKEYVKFFETIVKKWHKPEIDPNIVALGSVTPDQRIAVRATDEVTRYWFKIKDHLNTTIATLEKSDPYFYFSEAPASVVPGQSYTVETGTKIGEVDGPVADPVTLQFIQHDPVSVYWTNLKGVEENVDATLTKTAGNGWNAGAISQNELQPGDNGWIEFTLGANYINTGHRIYIGLSDDDASYSNSSIDHAFSIEGSQIRIVESGSTKKSVNVVEGDILRIVRNDKEIEYLINGNAVHTSPIQDTPRLMVDVSIFDQNATTPEIITSFTKGIQLDYTLEHIQPDGTMGTITMIPQDGSRSEKGSNWIQLDYTLEHIQPDGTMGTITMIPQDGAEPYSYAWGHGATTATVSDLAPGRYEVTVTDAEGRSKEQWFHIGYRPEWKNLKGVEEQADGTLIKTGGNGWGTGAASLNELQPNTDGWIEFVLDEQHIAPTNRFFIGLSDMDVDWSNNTIDHRLYFHNGVFRVMGNGSGKNIVNSKPGQVIRIERNGNEILYKLNDEVFYTNSEIDPSERLLIDITMYDQNAVTPLIAASFTKGIQLDYTLEHIQPDGTMGTITMIPQDGAEPYSYAWGHGATTATVSDLAPGRYEVTVTDAEGRSKEQWFHIGYRPEWKNLKGVEEQADGTLIKTGGNGWGTGAASLNELQPNTDGWIEFVLDEQHIAPTNRFFIGLSDMDVDWSNNTIDHRLYFHNGVFRVMGNGSGKNIVNSKPGQVIRIERNGNEILYKLNDEVFYTNSEIDPSERLLIDITMYDQNAVTPLIAASFTKASFTKGIQLDYTLEHIQPDGTMGTITMIPQDGAEPYSYAWGHGATTATVSDLAPGRYEVTVTDAEGRSKEQWFHIGYRPEWKNLKGVEEQADGTLIKTGGNGWGTGAASLNELQPNTDGWIEFVLDEQHIAPTNRFFIGLSDMDVDWSNNTIDHRLYFHNGVFRVMGNGSGKNIVNSKPGQVIRIERNGNEILYKLNDEVFYTNSEIDPSERLLIDITMYDQNAVTPKIASSFLRGSSTFYAVTSGNWNANGIWSNIEGGTAISAFPGPEDIVIINGYQIVLENNQNVKRLILRNDNGNTVLSVNGGVLSVQENIELSREITNTYQCVLEKSNNARVIVVE